MFYCSCLFGFEKENKLPKFISKEIHRVDWVYSYFKNNKTGVLVLSEVGLVLNETANMLLYDNEETPQMLTFIPRLSTHQT